MLTAIAPADCPAIVTRRGRRRRPRCFAGSIRAPRSDRAAHSCPKISWLTRLSIPGAQESRAGRVDRRWSQPRRRVCQLVAPVQRHRRGSVRIAAAIDPDHDRQPFIRGLGRGPDVQIQAVLVRRGRLLPRHRDTPLHARWRERGGLARAFPRHDPLRFTPAQVAKGRGGERHTHINSESVCVTPSRAPDSIPRVRPRRSLQSGTALPRHSSVPTVRHRNSPSPLAGSLESAVPAYRPERHLLGALRHKGTGGGGMRCASIPSRRAPA